MITDPFGNKIEFGTVLHVKKLRKDGKYQCSYHFKSTGKTIGAILTLKQIQDERERGKEVVGIALPE